MFKKIPAFFWFRPYDYEIEETKHKEYSFPHAELKDEKEDIIFLASKPIDKWQTVVIVEPTHKLEPENISKKDRLKFDGNFIWDWWNMLFWHDKLKNRNYTIEKRWFDYSDWYSNFHSDTNNALERIKRIDKQERAKNFMKDQWDICARLMQER